MDLSPFKIKSSSPLDVLILALRTIPGFCVTQLSVWVVSQFWPNMCSCDFDTSAAKLREEQGFKPFFEGFKKWEANPDHRQEYWNSLYKVGTGDQMLREKLKKMFQMTLQVCVHVDPIRAPERLPQICYIRDFSPFSSAPLGTWWVTLSCRHAVLGACLWLPHELQLFYL